jgi:hypothetical protein
VTDLHRLPYYPEGTCIASSITRRGPLSRVAAILSLQGISVSLAALRSDLLSKVFSPPVKGFVVRGILRYTVKIGSPFSNLVASQGGTM